MVNDLDSCYLCNSWFLGLFRLREPMRVEYQNTLDDLRALYRVLPLNWRLGVLRYVVVSALPGTILLAALGDWRELAICAAAQIAVFAYFYAVVRKKILLRNRAVMQPMTLSIDEQFVDVVSALGRGRRDWTMFPRIHQALGSLLIFASETEAFVVPPRAFASESQTSEFAMLARRYFDHSREPSYVPFTPPEPAEVVPSQSDEPAAVAQVRYLNNGEDLALVQLFGLAKSQPAWKRPGVWVWLVAVLALVFVVLCLRARGSDFAPMFFSLVAFLLLELVAMVVYSMVVVWSLARRVPPQALMPRVLTMTPHNVWLHTPRSEYRCGWSAIDVIGENERLVVLFLGQPRFLSVIPKTAFASRLECERFVQLTRQWKARAADEASPSNSPPRVETGNPYQSPAEG